MRFILLIHLLFLSTLSTFAQVSAQTASTEAKATEKGNGKVSGIIKDASTGAAVEFANVVIYPTGSTTPADGTIADDNGKFLLKNLADGSYYLSISFIGYTTRKVEDISISNGSNIDLGTLSIDPEVQNLEEVTIEGERQLVENKIDRLVYNAEKDITNVGGNAADVLSKVPQLSLDMDGNPQLRGSGNIRILINNKPSALMAGSVADALKQIPADQIKSVEVITSPSAKYDAEGTAGIINIITKKNNLEGLNGTVNAGIGTRSSNLGLNVGAKKGKLGFSLSTFTNAWYNRGEGENDQFYKISETRLLENSEQDNLGGHGSGSFGIDFDLNPKNTFSAGVKWRMFGMNNDVDIASEIFNANGTSDTTYRRELANRMRNINSDFNFDFIHTFDKPGHELSVLTLYSRNDQNRDYDFDQFNQDDVVNQRQRNYNKGLNEEMTAQIDYTRPIQKNTLEVGAKSIIRRLSSDFRLEDYDFATRDFIPVASRTDLFNYSQNVMASYLNYRINLEGGWGAQVGGRYEMTVIEGNFISQETKLNTDYDNWIPSLAVSKSFKKNNTSLKASYNQRIQRPNIFFLNPNINDANPRNIQYGNPNLDPELTHSFELGYNTFVKGTAINVSLYSRLTNNSIERYSFEVNDTVNTTFANIGKNATYGGSIYANYKITKQWDISGNANVYFVNLNSNSGLVSASNSGIMYNANLNSSYDLGKGWKAQAFGFFNSPRVQLQGKMSAFSFYSLGVRKEFWDKKGSLGVSMDNPFRKALVFYNQQETDQFLIDGETAMYNRGFKLNFSYQFGKMEAKGPRSFKRKKSINNDDMKGEGGGGQMGGN